MTPEEIALMRGTPDITVVMPVFNSMRFLPTVVPALLDAGRARGRVEFIFVDNGSTDGSYEFLSDLGTDVTTFRCLNVSIATLRNRGAARAIGTHLYFLDSDCLVTRQSMDAALRGLHTMGVEVTGHAYALPDRPNWIEKAWHELHYRSHAGSVQYVPGGNLFITRAAFHRVGGFRDDLWTGEDAELGQRLGAQGYRIYSDPEVHVIHLGNPTTLRGFHRKQVWHGLGMFGTARPAKLDKPIVMMLLHFGAGVGGFVILSRPFAGLGVRIALACGLQLFVPALTVAYRLISRRRLAAVLPSLLLYWIYYWARLQSVLVLITRGASKYRK